MIRTLIGDERPLSRRGVRMLLEGQPDIEVVGEARDGAEAVRAAVALVPDVVVLDATAQALEAAAEIRLRVPSAEVLVVSNYVDQHLAADVFAAGAQGFVVTADEPEELFACVRSLARHAPFIGSAASVRVPPLSALPPVAHANVVSPLTRRERMIVRLIAEGLRTREIAQQLDISEKTVESHRSAIFRKLEVESLADVVRYAVRNSMVKV